MLQRELIVVELVENPGLLGMWDIDLKKLTLIELHLGLTMLEHSHVLPLLKCGFLFP